MLVETSKLRTEADNDDEVKIIFPVASSNATVAQLSQSSTVFHNDGSVASKSFRAANLQEPLVNAAAMKSPSGPSLAQGTKDSERRPPSTIPLAIMHSPLANSMNFKSDVSELSPRQELLPTSSIHSLHEQHRKPEPEENTSAPKSNLVTIPLTSSTVEHGLFISILSEQAVATIFAIPKAHANAILSQAVSLKFKTNLVASKNLDDHDPTVIFKFVIDHTDREDNVLQTSLPTLMTTSNDREGRLRGLSMLQAVAAGMAVGSIGAWAALAFI